MDGQAVIRTLAGFDWEKLGSRGFQHRRDALITSNAQLLERELIKQQQLADGFGDALRRRGIDSDIAELAANVGSRSSGRPTGGGWQATTRTWPRSPEA